MSRNELLERSTASGDKPREIFNGRGEMVARVLRGCWRRDPPPPEIDEASLKEILPLLLRGGCGSLVWRSIRTTELGARPFASELRELHRYCALQNAVHSLALKEALTHLRDQGIEPLLVKGWALGPIYPEPGLRPFGDIDFCVRPAEYRAAATALEKFKNTGIPIDLHSGFAKFYDPDDDALFARSQLVPLDEIEVRIPGFEDHLRFLCLHLLRHGAGRPLWLCDIAAALEALPEGFDWDLCLGKSQPQTDWTLGAMGLAHHLLGVQIPLTPRLPRWLLPTVLAAWDVPFALPSPLAVHIRQPRQLLKELPRHWPNPIEATLVLNGGFNDWPRWPYQLGGVIEKITRLLVQTRGLTRRGY
jgi:hypothetical protein